MKHNGTPRVIAKNNYEVLQSVFEAKSSRFYVHILLTEGLVLHVTTYNASQVCNAECMQG